MTTELNAALRLARTALREAEHVHRQLLRAAACAELALHGITADTQGYVGRFRSPSVAHELRARAYNLECLIASLRSSLPTAARDGGKAAWYACRALQQWWATETCIDGHRGLLAARTAEAALDECAL